tara:strand:- start:309 stop:512 length:204 start_codon:yes stop_codon:yes gene_type:complete
LIGKPEDPQLYFKSLQTKQSKYRVAEKWNNADSFAKSSYFNNHGLIQLHPLFRNIYVNEKGYIQINN